MSDHKIQFGTLQEDGRVTDVRMIRQADVMACPYFILVAGHYRDDGSCRCNDPEHTEMADWGYTWDGETWGA